MCELFAVSSLYPSRLSLSLREISNHGSPDGPHSDGWGLAFYEGGDVRLLREPGPALDSPWVWLAERELPASSLIIGHIRHATQGAVRLSNTQPFLRELGGRMHAFAHNGDLRGEMPGGRFRPVGETDSERAFCLLLARMEPLWLQHPTVPPLAARLAVMRAFADLCVPLGPSNFAYCDGETLFVHGDRRRHSGETQIRPPGLHALWRNFIVETDPGSGGGLSLAPDGRDERSVLVASVPLTRENWIPLPRGEVLAIEGGRLVASAHPALVPA
jgi:glutamine amidotransferase